MAIPSLKSLTQSAVVVIRRFPFEALFALAGTVAATANTGLNSYIPAYESLCWRIMAMANLGLLLSLAVSLFFESKIIAAKNKLFYRLIAVVLIIGLFCIINPLENKADLIRVFLFSLALHLLVAFAAFTAPGGIQGFWQFNKSLFLRFLTGALYSTVLFLGLSAAISALNYLFKLHFDRDTYSYLWIWIFGMFNTIFFLAGIPSNLPILNNDTSYPKGLKIFTQFLLIPLASVYVAILLAYEIKIVFQWHLPEGTVSTLILSYAVFGILALLLVFPIRNGEGNKWIKSYTRSFYILLIPLIILLFVATGTRVFNYGVTEPRYFLVLLAIWLLFISIYFLASVKQNIKLIPISLCLFTLISIYGPQSAFRISVSSQRSVLRKIFERNNAYKNGFLIAVDSNRIISKDGNRAASVLEYLINYDDLKSLQPLFKSDLKKVADSLSKRKSRWNPGLSMNDTELQQLKVSWATKQLHLSHFSNNRYNDTAVNTNFGVEGRSFKIKIKDENMTRVSGFDYLIDANGSHFVGDKPSKPDTSTYHIGNLDAVKIMEYRCTSSVQINRITFNFDVQTFLDRLVKNKDLKNYQNKTEVVYETVYTLPTEKLILVKTIGKHQVALKINLLNYVKEAKSGKNIIIYIGANYLIK